MHDQEGGDAEENVETRKGPENDVDMVLEI